MEGKTEHDEFGRRALEYARLLQAKDMDWG